MKQVQQWTINPATFNLDGPKGLMSAQEFNAIKRPPCPVCGTTVDVDGVDVRRLEDRFPVLMAGRWECPNECDPRIGKVASWR